MVEIAIIPPTPSSIQSDLPESPKTPLSRSNSSSSTFTLINEESAPAIPPKSPRRSQFISNETPSAVQYSEAPSVLNKEVDVAVSKGMDVHEIESEYASAPTSPIDKEIDYSQPPRYSMAIIPETPPLNIPTRSALAKEFLEEADSPPESPTEELTRDFLAAAGFQNTPPATTKTFHIHAKGMRTFRLPFPSSEMEIRITNPDGGAAYSSVRGRRSASNSLLASNARGLLISTAYHLDQPDPSSGKGKRKRQTTLKLLRPTDGRRNSAEEVDEAFRATGTRDIHMTSSGLMRRTVRFKLPTQQTDMDLGAFEWRYVATRGPEGKEERLVLVHLPPAGPELAPSYRSSVADAEKAAAKAKKLQKKGRHTGPAPVVLATLNRVGRFDAGSGGELVIEEKCVEMGVPEEVVIAGCLVMLKRECDRLRIVQAAVVVGVLL
ncbi:hypothetical protein K402DRAFT_61684 [Aulographum hederae CBS 113979]|uniref:Uncharacterized protein n=1 Tax=Aulographum hederae CBS 113979 TaxID=1176131 RepID=A0A6G1H1Z7_9PEZI|nr:hypothetical protein K402DRAFT_61684 [Aulographum hederae CBS 113979]